MGGMEMNFPHQKRIAGAPEMRQDFRALISKAISQQGSSPTARLMLAANHHQVVAVANENDPLDERIRYFAAKLFPIDAATAPHGAFFLREVGDFSEVQTYDQVVYQDSLATGKNQSVKLSLSETQATQPGQEN
jgi:hypothetical protein